MKGVFTASRLLFHYEQIIFILQATGAVRLFKRTTRGYLQRRVTWPATSITMLLLRRQGNSQA